MAQRFAGAVISCLAMMPLVAAGQSDRLSVLFEGTATLNVSGDPMSCGVFVSCPMDCDYCECWNLCTQVGTRTRPAGSYLVLGGAGSSSPSFGSTARLTNSLNFTFRYTRPTVVIEGDFSYKPKTALGFGYFVDNVSAAALAVAAAGCLPRPTGCCESSSANSSSDINVFTSIATASASASVSGWCSCNCNPPENCASDQNSQFTEDPPSGVRRGVSVSSVNFERGHEVHHNERLWSNLSITANASGDCTASVAVGRSTAYAGLLLQSAPHPLGVPAIGENEYVWSSGTPPQLEIPARAQAHTWGWTPQSLEWMAEKTEFRVEPAIPTDDTKPGYRSVARGSEIVGQSLDGQSDSLIDGLVFRSKYLPPNNSDFGKKKVCLEVDGKEVDYADVEVFYPPDAKNHSPSRTGFWRVVNCTPEGETEVPNWFYYYSQVYNASDANYAFWLGSGIQGLTCGTTIYLSLLVSPSLGKMEVPLFMRDDNGQIALVVDEALEVKGIHKFVVVLEHERVHKRLCEMRVDVVCNRDITDTDNDDIDDNFESLCGLRPDSPMTVYGIPDAELIAYLIEYGKVVKRASYGDKIGLSTVSNTVYLSHHFHMLSWAAMGGDIQLPDMGIDS